MRLSFATLLAALALLCSALVTHAASPVVFGFDKAFPPYTYVEDGQPKGFALDLLQSALKESGLAITLHPDNWDAVQDGLKGGWVHVTAGMAKTPQRLKLFLFPSTPLADLNVRFFVKTNSGITTAKALDGKLVATQRGSLYHHILRDRGSYRLALYDTELEALTMMAAGEADAFCGEELAARHHMLEKGLAGIKAMGAPLKSSHLEYAVNADHPELLKALSDGLERSRSNGTYDRLYAKWFAPRK